LLKFYLIELFNVLSFNTNFSNDNKILNGYNFFFFLYMSVFSIYFTKYNLNSTDFNNELKLCENKLHEYSDCKLYLNNTIRDMSNIHKNNMDNVLPNLISDFTDPDIFIAINNKFSLDRAITYIENIVFPILQHKNVLGYITLDPLTFVWFIFISYATMSDSI